MKSESETALTAVHVLGQRDAECLATHAVERLTQQSLQPAARGEMLDDPVIHLE